MTNIEKLRENLLRGSLRYNSGIILTDALDSWKLDPICLQLHAFQIDFYTLLSKRILPNSKVFPFDEMDLVEGLREICQNASAQPVAMVLNLDLALAKLDQEAISRFWFNYSRLHPFSPTAVVAIIPINSLEIRPVGQDYDQWIDWKRLATWNVS
jgi:hypothetical protein